MSGPAPQSAGCLLCLLQLSASMERPSHFRGKEPSRLRAARLCLDHVLERLAELSDNEEPLAQGLRIGVVGFSGETVRSLLPGATTANMAPVEDVAALVIAERSSGIGRRLRVPRHSADGEASTTNALAVAHKALVDWLGDNPDARPPVLLLCGDDLRDDAERDRLIRSLRLLASARGMLRLGHGLYRDDYTGAFPGAPEEALPEAPRRLWSVSSPVSVRLDGGETVQGRALAINTTLYPLVHDLLSREDGLPPLEPAPPGTCSMRTLVTQKHGNMEDECEDAVECRPEEGLAVIGDGASEGIFTRRWARLLVGSYVEERPDVVDRAAFTAWIQRCRQTWMEGLDFPQMRGSQQNKVLDVGAGATVLAWQLGALGADGSYSWRGWAVGDSCLFWVRRRTLLASFPVVHWKDFGVAPVLLRSRRDLSPPAPVFASGRCLSGDRFFLATDAVAQELLRTVSEGREPDWEELKGLDAEGWSKRIETLREEKRITNDDSTLVVIEIGW